MGFHPANFKLLKPFRSRVSSRVLDRRTDRQTDIQTPPSFYNAPSPKWAGHNNSDINKGLKTKTKTPHNQHSCYFLWAVCKNSLWQSQWHNIPIQVSNCKKIHAHAAQLHHETTHATLWVSNEEAQPDQLPFQRKYINSSSIVSPILAQCGFIISPSWEKKTRKARERAVCRTVV